MSEIKVSVLIPVYGVEKYIEKCARSLFEQTMQEGIEFIFTDDCTKDKSIDVVKEVLREYPHRQSQVKFLKHRENLGLAEARVTGLKAAKGEYVIHCDSDDWVERNMYELMYTKACQTNADIVGCDFIKVLPYGEKVKKDNFLLNHDQLLEELLFGLKVEGYLWNRLIKRDFYIKGAYRANRGTTLFEDMAVTVPMHLNTNNIAYVSKALYHYRQNIENSMSANVNNRNINSAYKVLLSLSKLSLKKNWRELH